MKRLLLPSFLFLTLTANAQTFYVEPTEKGFEQSIVDKMKYKSCKLTENKIESDVTVKCVVDERYKFWTFGKMFHGYVKFNDTRTGQELARTKQVGKSPIPANGFQAVPRIMQVIADKHLLPVLAKLPQVAKKP